MGGGGEYMQFSAPSASPPFLSQDTDVQYIYTYFICLYFSIFALKKILADKVMQTRIANLPLSLG
jgi:hypothetical protein